MLSQHCVAGAALVPVENPNAEIQFGMLGRGFPTFLALQREQVELYQLPPALYHSSPCPFASDVYLCVQILPPPCPNTNPRPPWPSKFPTDFSPCPPPELARHPRATRRQAQSIIS